MFNHHVSRYPANPMEGLEMLVNVIEAENDPNIFHVEFTRFEIFLVHTLLENSLSDSSIFLIPPYYKNIAR